MSELTPPDKHRCQADKPNGQSFMTLGGGPKLVRCLNLPSVIAHENQPGFDGLMGSMALCAECQAQMVKQLGADFCTFEPIAY